MTTPSKDIESNTAEKEAAAAPSRGFPRWIVIALGIGLTVTTAVAVGAVFGMRQNKSSTINETTADTFETDECSTDASSDTENLPPTRRLQDSPFHSIGCFQSQETIDIHPLFTESLVDQATECSGKCFTQFFGVLGNTCRCFVETPTKRLAVGSCFSVTDCSVPSSKRMESFFHPRREKNCDQELTAAVRNFLVEEDDAPFGYDLVSNTFLQSPFDLYKDQCGTQIYEVQTEVSEGSKSLTTTVQTVEEFSRERRNQISQSLTYGVSAGYKNKLVSLSASVSGSNDQEQISVFKSSGANSRGSKVFTSTGVKRIAVVKIENFDNKKSFVSFSPQFGSLLREYRDGGYARETANRIINIYGHAVVVRGMFGGYMQLRTTVTNIDAERYFSSEEESRQCYEVSVSAEASAFGFTGSANAGTSGCSEEAKNEFKKLNSSYKQETSEQSVVGGGVVDGEFVVPPTQSRLLTTRDKYPEGDDGIELRLLSDFLAPDKVSPVEVRRSLITESEFGEIQSQLQDHILESLEDNAAILGECKDCDVPYLEQTSDGGFQCACYEPQSLTRSPTKAPTPAPTMSPTRTPRMTLRDIRMQAGDHWGLTNNESVRPSITVGGKTYYPHGNTFREVPQYAWKEFSGFSIPNLTAGRMELKIEVKGHCCPYVWNLYPNDWFKVQDNYRTEGKDTNGNKRYLRFQFDVIRA